MKALGISVNRASGVRDEGMRPEEWPPAGYYALLCAYTVETTEGPEETPSDREDRETSVQRSPERRASWWRRFFGFE